MPGRLIAESLLPRKLRHRMAIAWWIALAIYLLTLLGDPPLALSGMFVRFYAPLLLAAGLVLREIAARNDPRGRLERWVVTHLRSYARTSPTVLSETLAAGGGSAPVRVEGVLATETEVTSPHGVRCAAWRLEVDVLRPNDRAWSPLARGPMARESIVEVSSCDALTVESIGVLIKVGAGAELFVEGTKERVLTWKDFDREPGDVQKRVADALTLRGITRDDFTGVRVEEATIPAGANVTLFGTCRKAGDRFEVNGGDLPLVLTNWGPAHAGPGPVGTQTLASGARVLGVVALLALPVLALANPQRHGILGYHREPGSPGVWIDVFPMEKGASPLSWRMTRAEVAEDLDVTSNSNVIYVDNDADLVLSRVEQEEPEVYRVGRDERIRWTGAQWFLDLNAPSKTTHPWEITPVTSRRGQIGVRNLTALNVELGFVTQPGAHRPPPTWTWDFSPKQAAEYSVGSKLVNGADPIELATGDTIIVSQAPADSKEFEIVRRFWVGESPEVAWSGSAWQIAFDESSLSTRVGAIGVKNAGPDYFGVGLTNADGGTAGSWEFNPGEGAVNEFGLSLASSGDDVDVEPGYSVQLTREHLVQVYKGPLRSCPLAHFDRRRARWIIDASAAR